MLKKQLIIKCEEYRTQLDAAAEKEDKLNSIIVNYQNLLAAANEEIIDLKEKIATIEKSLDEHFGYEKRQLELFTEIINDYLGV